MPAEKIAPFYKGDPAKYTESLLLFEPQPVKKNRVGERLLTGYQLPPPAAMLQRTGLRAAKYTCRSYKRP